MFHRHSTIDPTSIISDLEDDGAPRIEYLEGNLKLLLTIETPAEVMCFKFNADGQTLAVGLSDGTIKLYQTENGQCIHSLSDLDTKSKHLPVTSLHFKSYNESSKVEHSHILVATYASGLIKTWHYTSASCLNTLDEIRQTLTSDFNPSFTKFMTAGADSQIHVYDAETNKLLRTHEPSDSRDLMNGHRARVFALKCHPLEKHLFITGGWDDTVQFWDDRQKHAYRNIYGPHICGDALDIDPSHNHILTGSWRKENVLQIWDWKSGEKIKDVPQDQLHGSLLYCSQWLGRDSIVCGGCDQNMCRIIDRGTLNTIGQLVDLPQGVFCIDNDRVGNRPKIAVGAAKKVYIIKTEKRS